MSIRITCPHCRAKFNVGNEWAGQQGVCNSCGGIVTVAPLEELLARHLKPVDAPPPATPSPATPPPTAPPAAAKPPAPAKPPATVKSPAMAKPPAVAKPVVANPPVSPSPAPAPVPASASASAPPSPNAHMLPKAKRARWAEESSAETSPPAAPAPAAPPPVKQPAAPVVAAVVEDPIDAVLLLPAAPPNTSPGSQPLRPEQVLAAIQGEIPPVTTTTGYGLSVALASCVMLVLPLLYLALIGVVVGLVYWHLTANFSIVGAGRSGRQQFASVLLYAAPALFGVTMILFMIKPLFARPAREPRMRSLTRESEPLLFALVERICAAVRAPFPQRIDVDCDVNASASFRRGLWSILAADDLVLTIGMPFVSGLTMSQFAGVLAHELGHFSQGAGLRLSFLVRRINLWFMRAVYERDAWDEWLNRIADMLGYRIGFIFHVARFCVWLTRRILWVFMQIGNAATGYLMRQMEFDADRYEARIAGSDTFEWTCRRMAQLQLAYHAALSDIRHWYSEGRLGDDLPMLMIARADEMPAELRDELDRSINESQTGWFDSHPADRERIASARREQAPGIFRLTRPASELFAGFGILCRLVTQDMYEHELGDDFNPSEMHPSADLLARRDRQRMELESLERITLNCFHLLRPIPLPPTLEPPANPRQLVDEIKQAREQLMQFRAAYRRLFHAFDDADTMVFEGTAAVAMYRARVPIPYATFRFHVPPAEHVDYVVAQARNTMIQRANEMYPFEYQTAVRIDRSLRLLWNPEIQSRLPDAGRWLQDARRFLPIIHTVNLANDQLQEIRNGRTAMGRLCQMLEQHHENAQLIQGIRSGNHWLMQQVNQYRSLLQNAEYPFDHAKGSIPLSDHLAPPLFDPEEIGQTYDATAQLLDRVTELNQRILGRLAWYAEQVETVLGLPPLEYPKDKGIEDRSMV